MYATLSWIAYSSLLVAMQIDNTLKFKVTKNIYTK